MRTHHDNTLHAIKRAKKRAGTKGEEDANRLIAEARNSGLTWEALPKGGLSEMLESRAAVQPDKTLKYYKGRVFVFFKRSRRCITIYDSPIVLPGDEPTAKGAGSPSEGYVDPVEKIINSLGSKK
jgi:hypothetical protein